jgi:hypothetical protein
LISSWLLERMIIRCPCGDIFAEGCCPCVLKLQRIDMLMAFLLVSGRTTSFDSVDCRFSLGCSPSFTALGHEGETLAAASAAAKAPSLSLIACFFISSPSSWPGRLLPSFELFLSSCQGCSVAEHAGAATTTPIFVS